jgi:proline dehydrogenase
LTITLDLLGENVGTEAEARAAVAGYVETLRRMAGSGLEPNISVKLTMLGLDLGEALAEATLRQILGVARAVDGFVRVDMEGSAYTARHARPGREAPRRVRRLRGYRRPELPLSVRPPTSRA